MIIIDSTYTDTAISMTKKESNPRANGQDCIPNAAKWWYWEKMTSTESIAIRPLSNRQWPPVCL